MGVMMYRAPTEGVEEFKKAVSLIELIQEIVNNPKDVSATLKDLNAQIVASSKFSDEFNAQLLDAQETIAQAKDLVDELEQEKKEFANQVKEHNEKVARELESIKNSTDALVNEKASMQKAMEKNSNDAASKLAEATKAKNEAISILSTNKELEKNLADRETALQKERENWEKIKQQEEEDFISRLEAHELEVQTHEQKVQAFEARKKRFDDALKE